MMQYFIGLGSNIDPEENMVKMIKALFRWSDQVEVSEIFRFAPHKIVSDQYFLNTVVRIQSPLSPSELKTNLIQLEEKLGRDRNDPDKKTKDRTADLDILFSLESHQKQFDIANLEEAEYVLYPLEKLLQFLDFETKTKLKNKVLNKVELVLYGKRIGEKAVSLCE